MKRILQLFCLLALSFCFYSSSNASHVVGGDMEFECINTCTLRVHLRIYRDCAGIANVSNNINWAQVSGSGCSAPLPIGAWSAQITTEITPICPSVATQCSNSQSSIMGVEEFYWWRDFNVCGVGNCTYAASWSSCCRNAAITSGASNVGAYLETQMTFGLATCNSSPQFTANPFFFACQGNAMTVNQGAYDPDGDSLSFSMGPCYSAANTPVPYSAGYAPTAPLGPTWTVTIDPTNGNLNLTPIPGNIVTGVICVQVQEWRNGVLIGTYLRDMQVSVVNCGPNNFPTHNAITNITGGAYEQNGIIYACNGSSFCFDIPTSDPDTGQISVWWDQNIAGATFTDAANASTQNTVTGYAPVGRFCFPNPTPGVYQFLTRVQDQSCGYLAYEDAFYTIVVGNSTGASASATPAGCNVATFNASACGGTPPYSYAWTGSGGLVGTASNFNYTYNASGTFTWQVIVNDAAAWADTVTGTVTLGGPNYAQIITASPSAMLCPASSVTLDAGTGFASYFWSNGATSQATTIATAGVYNVSVTDTNGCQFYDSVTVTVNTNPTAVNLITGNPVIKACNPQPVTLTATSGYSAYQWSNGGTSTSITTTTPGVYSVVATDPNGCLFTDSMIVVLDSLPDLAGYVTTSSNAPLVNQNVLLIKFDWNVLSLTQVGSSLTTSNGYYEFCEVTDTLVFLKATPDSATYPGEMPTYADTTLFWNSAIPFSMFWAPFTHNFSTLAGSNPGGPGFIGGLVSQGANKTAGVGDPIDGLDLFLINKANGQIIDHVVTDTNGGFLFGSIAYGTYLIKCDHPFVTTKNDSTPEITVSASNPGYDEVKLLLHSTYLELDGLSGLKHPVQIAFDFSAFPNPQVAGTTLRVVLEEASGMDLAVYDLSGQLVSLLFAGNLPAGTHEFEWNQEMAPGIYFARLNAGEHTQSLKLLKLNPAK